MGRSGITLDMTVWQTLKPSFRALRSQSDKKTVEALWESRRMPSLASAPDVGNDEAGGETGPDLLLYFILELFNLLPGGNLLAKSSKHTMATCTFHVRKSEGQTDFICCMGPAGAGHSELSPPYLHTGFH